MITDTAIASFDAPRYGCYFMEDNEEEGMATARQRDTIKNLIYLNIESDELRESHLNQLRNISEQEAKLWIKELENGMW